MLLKPLFLCNCLEDFISSVIFSSNHLIHIFWNSHVRQELVYSITNYFAKELWAHFTIKESFYDCIQQLKDKSLREWVVGNFSL